MSWIKIKLAVCLATAALFAYATAYADVYAAETKRTGKGDPVAGKAKSTLCQSCHGEDGLSTENLIPNLAGQYSEYIKKQIRDFQSGARKHEIMNVMAKTVNEFNLDDIAAYFANLDIMRGGGWGKNAIAKNLFLKGDKARNIQPCASCHGVNGKGKATAAGAFPVIGGQHKAYLRAQLINWRKGERTNSPNGIMNNVARSLTDAEIEALTDYISGL